MRLRWCPSFGNEVTDLARARLLEQYSQTLVSAGAQVEQADPWGSDIDGICQASQEPFVLMAMSSDKPDTDDAVDSAHDLAVALSGSEVDYWSWMNFCVPYNFTGQPSIVLPIGQTPDGLPIVVQIIGRRWDDLRLLAIAAALEPFASEGIAPPMTWCR